MKKIFTILFMVLLSYSVPVFGDGIDGGDLWNIHGIDQGKETKAVSDEEFEEAIKKLDAKQNKWRNWAQKLRQPRGEAFSQSHETEDISNGQGAKASLPVVCIPVDLQVGEGIIPVGHYQIEGEKNGNNISLTFYQAHKVFAKVPAIETFEDYDKEEILFADLLTDEGDDKVKIIYGSLDFNAFVILSIAK